MGEELHEEEGLGRTSRWTRRRRKQSSHTCTGEKSRFAQALLACAGHNTPWTRTRTPSPRAHTPYTCLRATARIAHTCPGNGRPGATGEWQLTVFATTTTQLVKPGDARTTPKAVGRVPFLMPVLQSSGTCIYVWERQPRLLVTVKPVVHGVPASATTPHHTSTYVSHTTQASPSHCSRCCSASVATRKGKIEKVDSCQTVS